MIRFMLDTNVCIDLLRERNSEVLSRFDSCRVGEVAISTITLAELQHGAFKSSDPSLNREVITDFCTMLEILPFDDEDAEHYGQIRAALERVGTPIGPLYTLIAAHAVSVGCTLVTSNQREFSRVDGLTVENWTDGKNAV